MNRDQVLAMRARGYSWSDIGRLFDTNGFCAWMLFGPVFGGRTR